MPAPDNRAPRTLVTVLGSNVFLSERGRASRCELGSWDLEEGILLELPFKAMLC